MLWKSSSFARLARLKRHLRERYFTRNLWVPASTSKVFPGKVMVAVVLGGITVVISMPASVVCHELLAVP
jgi:hypothetical protein